jgi:dienelactone hydrolase
MVKLHGLDTYVTEPPEGRPAKGIIVIIPDAFGIDFINNKILADIYAAKGDYKVYLPDFMRGMHSDYIYHMHSDRPSHTDGY